MMLVGRSVPLNFLKRMDLTICIAPFFIEDTLLINRLPRPGSEQPLKSVLHSPKSLT